MAAGENRFVRGNDCVYSPAPSMRQHAPLIVAHRRTGWMIVLVLVAALALFVTGIFLPFTAVTKLWLFENQISVYRGLLILWQESELFLFLILFVFTVCFPFVKINALLALWLYPALSVERAATFRRFVSSMGKWSMLDVFIVAILVLTVKSGGLASIQVKSGFFLFFLSVMLTQLGSMWTDRIVSLKLSSNHDEPGAAQPQPQSTVAKSQ
jgi:paraquat-inducible protein A